MNGSTVAHELLAACLESPGKTQRSTEWVNQVLLSQTIEQGLLLREQSEALRRIENSQNALSSYLTRSLKTRVQQSVAQLFYPVLFLFLHCLLNQKNEKTPEHSVETHCCCAMSQHRTKPSESRTPNTSDQSPNQSVQALPVMSAPIVRMPIPQPGTPGAPNFDGRNATSFLRRFHQLCRDHGYDKDEEIMSRLTDYCDIWIGDWMTSLTSFTMKDWNAFTKTVTKEFRDKDVDQLIHTRKYLEGYKRQPRDEKFIREYIREYTALSTKVKSKQLIDGPTQTQWFIDGLPEKYRKQVVKKTDIDPEDPTTMDFESAKQNAIEVMEKTERSDKLINPERYRPEVNQLAQEYGQSAQSVLRQSAPVAEYPEGRAPVTSNDIDGLTRQIEALHLPLRAMTNKITRPVSGDGQTVETTTKLNRAEYGPNRCYYCGLENCRKDRCSEFNYDREAGRCHINPQTGRVHVGPAEGGGGSIRLLSNEPNMQSVRRAYDEWRRDNGPLGGGQLPAQNNFIHANVSSIRVGSVSQENEEVYDTDEDGEEAEVNAFNVSGTAGKKREASSMPLPAVRTRRAGFYDDPTRFERQTSEPTGDRDVDMSDDSAPLTSTIPSQETRVKTRSDNKAPKSILKKSVTDGAPTPTILNSSGPAPATERPGPGKLATELKQFDNTGDLLGKILNQPLEGVTVRDLLGSSPSLHKAFFQQLPNISDTVVPRPPTPPTTGKVSAQRVVEDKRRSEPVRTSQVIYAMDVLRTETSINNRTLPTLIDTGSMINVMREDIARELGLDLTYGPNLTMVVQSGEAVPCTACAEDVPVSIGDITTHTPVFIVQGGDQDFILGRPFAHLVRMATAEQDDGSCLCTAYSGDRLRRITFTAYRPSREDIKVAADIWKKRYQPLN